jgi:prepilin-type N-terminal cleavage/methylation domain-containing protein
MKKNQGFTLIELLVSILILALIVTIGLVAMKNARAKSRDAKRLYDIQQYAKALRIYAHEDPSGAYPPDNGYLGAGHSDGAPNVNNLLRPHFPDLPSDPQDGQTDKYYYYVAANDCGGEIFPTVHVQTIETSNQDYYDNRCNPGTDDGNAREADYLIIIR